ncbi:MAG TPA: asparaginase [Gammaproteobacteria bacterium]|jgi:L-asparaginase|nr:asparaginase domain-containing protein [Gammaproteobacteria bacterium]HAY41274.1 asparaginase [Gammaproteobacteria bacterium]|tara:strand:+ start:1381 stop:1878 length:498 start_codon:yes stop_codon:yes gene_type:complete
MKIKLLVTGGTIDKVYNKLNGALEFNESHIEDMLIRGRVTNDISVGKILLKDSLDFTNEDRRVIISECNKCPLDKIVITHGTDTMCQTAQEISQKVKNKTIVLFGSMTPYSIKNSDALLNLGLAIAAVQLKKHGVYIAMNGKVFDYDNVKKNKELGIFERLKVQG